MNCIQHTCSSLIVNETLTRIFLFHLEAHGLSKNLICKQSSSKGSEDENKMNTFITSIKEQRHHDFLCVHTVFVVVTLKISPN